MDWVKSSGAVDAAGALGFSSDRARANSVSNRISCSRPRSYVMHAAVSTASASSSPPDQTHMRAGPVAHARCRRQFQGGRSAATFVEQPRTQNGFILLSPLRLNNGLWQVGWQPPPAFANSIWPPRKTGPRTEVEWRNSGLVLPAAAVTPCPPPPASRPQPALPADSP